MSGELRLCDFSREIKGDKGGVRVECRETCLFCKDWLAL